MPFFDEGADPLDPPALNPAGRMPTGVNAPDPFNGPTPEQISGAAFRQNNPVVSVLDAITRSRPDMTPVDGYDPVKRLSGTKDDDLIEQSLADVNPAQTDARIAKKEAEVKDRQTLAASGWLGTVSSIAAGATDPSWFIPVLGEVKAGAELSVAARALRGMGEGAAKSVVSEAGLQASQVTRTPGESVANIATNTLLMGIIGGGMAALNPVERAAAKDGLEGIRKDLSQQPPQPQFTDDELSEHVGRWVDGARGNANLAALPHAVERFGEPLKSQTTFYRGEWPGRPDFGDEDNSISVSSRKVGEDFSLMRNDEELEKQPHDGLGPPQLPLSEIIVPPGTKVLDTTKLVAENGEAEKMLPPGRFVLQGQRVEPFKFGEGDAEHVIKTYRFEPKTSQPELPFHDQTNIVPHEPVEPQTLTSSLSAAASDQRSMKLSRILLPDNMMSALKEVPVLGNAIDYSSKVLMNFSPTLRIFSSDSLVAKQALGDLAETSLRFTQADSGITSARGGVPIDRLVKMQAHDGQLTNSQILRDQFIAYRQLSDTRAPIITAGMQDLRGKAPGKLSFDDFKTEVSGAMTNGDVHAIPEVQQAAQAIRQQVLEPVKKMAQRTLGPDGKPMLGEELEPPKGDKSFFPRVWNKQKLAANYNGAKKIFADWLEGEQGIKAAAKDRLIGHSQRLEASEARIAALEKKIEALPENSKVRADLEYDARLEAERRDGIRKNVEKELQDWQGSASKGAKSAIKARDAEARSPDLPRLRAADPEVDAAMRRIIASDRDLTREELESRAAEIMNRINSAPDGRLPYDSASGGPSVPVPSGGQQVRGALNSRDFAIPTSLVKDFVNTDTEHVIASHLHSAIPDIHLTDRFGDVEMQDVFRRLDEEYDGRMAKATSAKQQVNLDNERKAMVRDLAATRDRIRGTYGFELAKTQPNAARIANAARNFNLITDLGTSVFNRMTDSINAVYRHGFMNVMGDGYLPFFKSMVGMGDGFATSSRQSMKDLGVGIDSAIGHLSHQWGDVIDNSMPGSKFERALAWTADKSMMLNLHGPWTDGMKTVAGTVAAADFLRTAERIAGGTHTAADIQRMAQAGIEPHMATRIWEAYKDGGGQEFGKGTHVANTADWKDTHARDVFAAAIGRDADMAVLTPGAEKPLWMSGPVVSLLGQYKSFVSAAHEKVLISNLQQMDARTLQGLVASLGMGMISYRAYTLWSGAPTSDRPQDWIKEGISRSAILGWFTELNSIQAKFTGGQTDMFRAIGADKPLSRRQSNGALSELLGPTYSKLEGIAGGINDASHGTWTAQDTHKFRQAIFLQNLFFVRRLFDAAEDGFNNQLGVKPLNRDASTWPGATQSTH